MLTTDYESLKIKIKWGHISKISSGIFGLQTTVTATIGRESVKTGHSIEFVS